MSVAKQLYQLQEVDLEIDSHEQTIGQVTGQLGESEAVINVRNKLASAQQQRAELSRQQQSVEWEIDDRSGKITTAEEELYSGRIRNPKELANLQHETYLLRDKRRQLEEQALEMMDRAEAITRKMATLASEVKSLEAEWQQQQQQLSAQLGQLKTELVELNRQRQLMVNGIDPQAVEVYQGLKKHKGTAVARVEQGICRGCRITLPVTELQQVRGGGLVRCGSCSRILFSP